jgi:hypothetical protein
MLQYSRHWFCALSGSVRGRESEFRDAHKMKTAFGENIGIAAKM